MLLLSKTTKVFFFVNLVMLYGILSNSMLSDKKNDIIAPDYRFC